MQVSGREAMWISSTDTACEESVRHIGAQVPQEMDKETGGEGEAHRTFFVPLISFFFNKKMYTSLTYQRLSCFVLSLT